MKPVADSDATGGDRIEARRKDKKFQARLSKLIEENGRVLERLAR